MTFLRCLPRCCLEHVRRTTLGGGAGILDGRNALGSIDNAVNTHSGCASSSRVWRFCLAAEQVRHGISQCSTSIREVAEVAVALVAVSVNTTMLKSIQRTPLKLVWCLNVVERMVVKGDSSLPFNVLGSRSTTAVPYSTFFCTRSLQKVSIQHHKRWKRKGTNSERERKMFPGPPPRAS